MLSKIKPVILAFVLLLTMLARNSYAQIPGRPLNLQSPNAAGLGLYGEIPVSYFTGIPKIEAPLYQIEDREITLPISLSYHASGFRPDVHPGWVGMGWALNAGGVISRKVNGMMDEFDFVKLNHSYQGYYFKHSLNNNSLWNDQAHMKILISGFDINPMDTEPDEFSFNFLDYSGKFYMGEDGEWKVKCDKPVKVFFDGVFMDTPWQYTAPSESIGAGGRYVRPFSGFTIVTEDGTKYVFGGTNEAIEYSISFFNQYTSHWIAGSWYLKKIVSARGTTVDFKL